MKISIYKLKDIMENPSLRYAICCYNTSIGLMNEIKNNLNNDNNTNIIIDIRELDLTNFELIKSIIPNDLNVKSISKLLFESMIYEKIMQDLLNIHKEELKWYQDKFKNMLDAFNNNMNAKRFNDINIDGIITSNIIDGMVEKLKMKDIDVMINIFIPNNTKVVIQNSLNSLLNDRYPYNTRFYVEGDSLSTYYDSNGFLLEEMHDYHSYDLCEIISINDKTKKKFYN